MSSNKPHLVMRGAGSPVALLVIVAWALCGPLFHYSESWQLVINTGTTTDDGTIAE